MNLKEFHPDNSDRVIDSSEIKHGALFVPIQGDIRLSLYIGENMEEVQCLLKGPPELGFNSEKEVILTSIFPVLRQDLLGEKFPFVILGDRSFIHISMEGSFIERELLWGLALAQRNPNTTAMLDLTTLHRTNPVLSLKLMDILCGVVVLERTGWAQASIRCFSFPHKRITFRFNVPLWCTTNEQALLSGLFHTFVQVSPRGPTLFLHTGNGGFIQKDCLNGVLNSFCLVPDLSTSSS